MPLRDFDQVRERIHLRVEIRHIVQGVLLVATLVGAAFAGGIWYARERPVPAVAADAATASASPEGLPPAAVAVARATTPSDETPIVPTPVVVAVAAPDAAVAPEPAPHEPEPATAARDVARADAPSAEPSPEQFATSPGERAVTPSELAVAAAAPTKAPEVAVVVPVAPAPIAPKPVPVPAPPVAPTPVVAVAPPAAPGKPPAPAPVVRSPAPRGLGLFGTLRMAPTVAVVASVTPAAAALDDKSRATPPHKPVVKAREDDIRPPPVSGHYVIQIKAFRDQKEALAFETDLRGKGHAPKLTSIEVPEKGTFYRVRLGPFDSLDAARAAQKQFEAAEGHVTILLAVP